MSFHRTLFIGCTCRAREMLQELLEGDDGVYEPTVVLFPGGSLHFAISDTSAAMVQGIHQVLEQVDKVIIQDHDGGHTGPGCPFYLAEYAPGQSALDPELEYLQHRTNLARAAQFIRQALLGLGRAGQVEVHKELVHPGDRMTTF